MEKFTTLSGIAAPLMPANINTGAIIAPIDRRSRSIDLGQKLFTNWRYGPDGTEIPDFILNQPRFRNSTILIAGPNFGCGSSRERAVWALMRFGIRCVIAPSFGDIFLSNAFQNGLLPVSSTPRRAAGSPCRERGGEPIVTVDLERCTVSWPDGADSLHAARGSPHGADRRTRRDLSDPADGTTSTLSRPGFEARSHGFFGPSGTGLCRAERH